MVTINLAGPIEQLQLSPAQAQLLCQAVLDSVTQRIVENVRTQAGQALHSTRTAYLKGIIVSSAGRLQNTIALAGRMPNMLEDGAQAFDMKAGLLASAKVKTTKNGNKYITVPFRHGAAGSLSENEAFSSVMAPEVWALAKRLTATTSAPGGGVAYGGSLKKQNLPAPFDQELTRPKITQNTGKLTPQQLAPYQHAAPINAGIYREEKTYQNATQNQYVSFRRISLSKSAVNSWIHKGIAAHHFMDKGLAATNLDLATQIAVDNALDAILG